MDDTERRCQFCGEVRPLEAFRRDKSVPSGFRPLCKECRNLRDRERYAEGLKSTWPTREEIEANNAALRAAARARRAQDDVHDDVHANEVDLIEKPKPPKEPPEPAHDKEEIAPRGDVAPDKPTAQSPPKRKSKLWVAPTERPAWYEDDGDHWRQPDSQC